MRQRIDGHADVPRVEAVISPPQSPARSLRHGSPLSPARQPTPDTQQNPPQQALGVSPELLQRLHLSADKPEHVAVQLSWALFSAEERINTCLAKMDCGKVHELQEYLFATCQTPRGQRKQIWNKAKKSIDAHTR